MSMYEPDDKLKRTKNRTSDWERGIVSPSDIPLKGKWVYVNRPQNNAYAEECKVELCAEKNVFRVRSPRDNWAHYFSSYDIGNDVFFDYEEAVNALHEVQHDR